MKNIIKNVEKHRQIILDAERYIWAHPETGYKEFETSNYMAEQFIKLGYNLTYADGITGFYTDIDTGRNGPKVLILAELDSVICPEHKDSNPVTGAVHACGHNAQCAAMVGIAGALKEPNALNDLCGSIRLCVVPAEELLEIEFRRSLKAKGIIKYYGGKGEFLYRGYFDGVDIAFMVHSSSSFCALSGAVGCVAKNITYKGLAAHAGGSPNRGINALYAATNGLNAVNALRETFKENDYIRFHPIVTKGGEMVNAIPETVNIESYVRGASFDAISRENKKVNRALIGGALSIGANVEIVDVPGYAPLKNDKNMIDVAKEAYELMFNEDFKVYSDISTGSTDMGDLSLIMPVIHPYCGGAKGKGHGNDYEIYDPEQACVKSASWQVGMLFVLLSNNGERGYKVISEYKPTFASKEEFLKFQDSLNDSGDRIIYTENSAQIRL